MLSGRIAAGAEIPFEVGETGGESPSRHATALYAYRPLTSEFVAAQAEQLRGLDSFEVAAMNLARTRGAVAYLRGRDEPVLEVSEITHARLAVLAFVAHVWDQAESFDEFEERFARAYVELESVVLAARLVTSVFVPVHGVVLETTELNLGDGVQLVAPEFLAADAVARFADEPRTADSYCAISIDSPSDAPLPIAELRHEARSALTALRMFKPGSVSFGLNAQCEVAGVWRQVAMPFSGRAYEDAWRLGDGEDEELRQFIAAVRRVEKRTRTAWALKRFEMGLERTVPAEGLTDFLLALRSLLEAADDSGRAALPSRVAALCAREDDRERVATTIECAFALERLAVHGSVGKEDRKRVAMHPPLATIGEVERCVRALLHDLICGYLSSDLRKLADEILLADGDPLPVEAEIDADAGYYRPASDLAAGAVEPEPEAEESTLPTQEFEAVFDDKAAISAFDLREGDVAVDDAPTTAFTTEIEPAAATPTDPVPEDPAPATTDAWTSKVLSDDSEWWSPERRSEQPVPQSPEESGPQSRQIAEDLVDGYDNALVESLAEDEATPPQHDRHSADGRLSFTPPGESEMTFSFPVIDREPESPAPRRGERPVPQRDAAAGDADFPDFPVPEFSMPDRVRHERLRELLGDHAPERASFDQIMTTSYPRIKRTVTKHEQLEQVPELEPEAAAPQSSPAPPAFQRPRLVALEGGAAPTPTPPAPAPATPTPEPVDQPVDHDEARGAGFGPATIEFRPLVEPDPEDPDDFSGAV